jgi:BirA family biotin operon repressor/biotin-[acetyl-CoA-carboxylase] ligase
MDQQTQRRKSQLTVDGKTDAIEPQRLTDAGVVAQVEYHRTLESTQLRAHELARADCGPLPLLVVAEEQTAGRGRGTNRWWTGSGSLAFSLLFEPEAWGLPREPQPGHSLAVGVAIVETVRPLLDDRTLGLHWPNDVFVQGKKLAGVLIDVLHAGRHVVGVGLNVNNTLDAAPAEVRARATSLCELAGRAFDRTELLAELVRNLERTVRASTEGDGIGRRFGELCLQVGKVLTIETRGERVTGRCAGIESDGSLLVDTETGMRRFYSGALVQA